MNAYQELRMHQQEEVDKFPMKFAFSQKQFEEGMKELGLKPTDTKKVVGIPGGGFIRKSDAPALKEMFLRHAKERAAAVAADSDGMGYIYDMFLYELKAHEFGYTGSSEETLESLGYTLEQVRADQKLNRGFEAACDFIYRQEAG